MVIISVDLLIYESSLWLFKKLKGYTLFLNTQHLGHKEEENEDFSLKHVYAVS